MAKLPPWITLCFREQAAAWWLWSAFLCHWLQLYFLLNPAVVKARHISLRPHKPRAPKRNLFFFDINANVLNTSRISKAIWLFYSRLMITWLTFFFSWWTRFAWSHCGNIMKKKWNNKPKTDFVFTLLQKAWNSLQLEIANEKRNSHFRSLPCF